MIGELPTELEIGKERWGIRSDFRIALLIFQAFGDMELIQKEKTFLMLDALIVNFNKLPREYYQEAVEKAVFFLDGGNGDEQYEGNEIIRNNIKTLDWEQDERYLFAAVNKAAGKEIRSEKYLHWWTFLSYFQEIGECVLSSIMSIRYKKAKGIRLEKSEQQYYRENKSIIDIKKKYTAEELAEREYWNRLLG